MNRNADEISLANFTVVAGEDRLSRGANGVTGGGVVENGALKGGKTVMTNETVDTGTGKFFISQDPLEDI